MITLTKNVSSFIRILLTFSKQLSLIKGLIIRFYFSKHYTIVCTCVCPPAKCCALLRGTEALVTKHWRNDCKVLHAPNANSSYN